MRPARRLREEGVDCGEVERSGEVFGYLLAPPLAHKDFIDPPNHEDLGPCSRRVALHRHSAPWSVARISIRFFQQNWLPGRRGWELIVDQKGGPLCSTISLVPVFRSC